MKNTKFLILVVILFALSNISFAQGDNGFEIDWLISSGEALVGALTLVIGFITKAFFHDKENTKLNLAVKVAVAGMIVAVGAVKFGIAEFMPSTLIVFTTMGIYDAVRGLFKSSKPKVNE